MNIFEQDGHFDAQASSSWFTTAAGVEDSLVGVSFRGLVSLITMSFIGGGSLSSIVFVAVSNVLLLLSLIGGVLGTSQLDDSLIRFCIVEDEVD